MKRKFRYIEQKALLSMNETNNLSLTRVLWRFSKWIFILTLSLVLLISVALYLMRDKIVGLVVTEVNKNLNAPVKVEDLSLTFWASFPNLSVDFNNVYIQSANKGALATDTLLYADRIRLKFNPFEVLKKNYQVKEVEVFPGVCNIKTLANNETNYDILKTSADTTSTTFAFNLQTVRFHDFRLSYEHVDQNQYYETQLNQAVFNGNFSEKKFLMAIETNMNVSKVQSGNVTLVKNAPAYCHLQMIVDRSTNTFQIPKSPVHVAELPFVFDLMVNEEDIVLHLKSKGLHLTDLAKRLHHNSTDKVKEFKGKGQLQFALAFEQPRGEKANIQCDFAISNGQIIEPTQGLPLKNIHLSAYYSNNDKTFGEVLNIKNVQFHTAAGPFKGKLRLTDFNAPWLVGEANGLIDLGVVHKIFPLPTIETAKGQVKVAGNFDIKMNSGKTDLRQVNGNLHFSEVQFQQFNDKRYYDHINGEIYLRDKVAGMDRLSLTVGKSDLSMTGTFRNLEEYLNQEERLLVNAEVRSAFMDIQDFSSSTKEEKIENDRHFILPNQIEGNINLLSNNLQYENHQFKFLRANLGIDNRTLTFRDLSLQNAEADINGRVKIAENTPEIFTIETQASTKNLRFKPLFKEWNNFEQEVLTSDQINGVAAVDLEFKAPFDLRSGINKKAILASVKLKVEEGSLTNVLAFKEITNSLKESKATRLILKQNNINRFEEDLLHLKFEKFENTFTIQNGRIEIPRMYIASNAIDINVSGTHDFDNQVDYSFDFNFRDIRRQNMDTEFGEVIDDGTGLRLFVRMFGPIDNPTIKWDQEARKALAKENFQQEKRNTKAMLKSELGLFKKDTTIQAYVAKIQPKEEVRMMQYGQEEPLNDKPKKETKLQKTFTKWKEEAEKEKEGRVTFAPF